MSKQDVFWFKHDANARRDQKILELLSIYGYEGYGWWWALLEMMREAGEYKLKMSGKYAIKTLAKELQTTPERLKEFLDDCIKEFGLFESDGESFWSPSLLRRMDAYSALCQKRREAVNTRWGK